MTDIFHVLFGEGPGIDDILDPTLLWKIANPRYENVLSSISLQKKREGSKKLCKIPQVLSMWVSKNSTIFWQTHKISLNLKVIWIFDSQSRERFLNSGFSGQFQVNCSSKSKRKKDSYDFSQLVWETDVFIAPIIKSVHGFQKSTEKCVQMRRQL